MAAQARLMHGAAHDGVMMSLQCPAQASEAVSATAAQQQLPLQVALLKVAATLEDGASAGLDLLHQQLP